MSCPQKTPLTLTATSKYYQVSVIHYRYPFLCGEIFNCELTQIMEKFFEVPEEPEPALITIEEKIKSPPTIKRIDTLEEDVESGSPMTDTDKDDDN